MFFILFYLLNRLSRSQIKVSNTADEKQNHHRVNVALTVYHDPFSVCLTGAPNENIVQNHLNIALLNVFSI